MLGRSPVFYPRLIPARNSWIRRLRMDNTRTKSQICYLPHTLSVPAKTKFKPFSLSFFHYQTKLQSVAFYRIPSKISFFLSYHGSNLFWSLYIFFHIWCIKSEIIKAKFKYLIKVIVALPLITKRSRDSLLYVKQYGVLKMKT